MTYAPLPRPMGEILGRQPARILVTPSKTPSAWYGAIRDTIATRAARLNIKPFGLRLIIEEHERLREKQGRRPTMEQLERALEAATDLLTRRAQADEAYKCEAEFHARRSTQMAEASVNAVAYLRACA